MILVTPTHPRGHLAMSGDTFDCQLGVGVVLASNGVRVTRNAAEHVGRHRKIPFNKEVQLQMSRCCVEKFWSRC